jgi:hypothetical protein
MIDPDLPEADMFVVYYRGGAALEAASISRMTRRLDTRLFLVSTPQTQSKLYHHVKRLAQPEALFVARVDALPKFMGMEEGTTKWVRGMMDT